MGRERKEKEGARRAVPAGARRRGSPGRTALRRLAQGGAAPEAREDGTRCSGLAALRGAAGSRASAG
jgi:hypothetical protein